MSPVTQPAKNHFDIRPYLQAARLGRWVYEQTDVPPREDRPAATYARSLTPQRFQEGSIERRPIARLTQYMQSSRGTTTQPAPPPAHRGTPVVQGALVAFFELGESMPPIPEELQPGTPITTSTELHYYDQYGRPSSTGMLTRTAEIEGFEPVETPAGKFDDTLRVRVDLAARFSWLAFDWTSYLWLSKKVGEVRRVNRMSGWFLIFYFGSSHEYRLTSYQPAPAGSQPSLSPAAEWARGLLVLSRVIPHPQIAGMVVDFAKP